MGEKRLYSTKEVADLAGVSRDTLIRWLRDGKVPEPDRNRNNWRMFNERELKAVLRYATKIIPSPRKRQRELSLNTQ